MHFLWIFLNLVLLHQFFNRHSFFKSNWIEKVFIVFQFSIFEKSKYNSFMKTVGALHQNFFQRRWRKTDPLQNLFQLGIPMQGHLQQSLCLKQIFFLEVIGTHLSGINLHYGLVFFISIFVEDIFLINQFFFLGSSYRWSKWHLEGTHSCSKT